MLASVGSGAWLCALLAVQHWAGDFIFLYLGIFPVKGANNGTPHSQGCSEDRVSRHPAGTRHNGQTQQELHVMATLVRHAPSTPLPEHLVPSGLS